MNLNPIKNVLDKKYKAYIVRIRVRSNIHE